MDAELVKLILWIIGVVIAFLWGLAKAKWHLMEGRKAKVVGIAEIAILQIYEDFVREVKEKSADGKLSMDDIKSARTMAWNRACDIAKGQGVNFAKEMAKEYFPVLIDKIIKAVKKSK